ncbi:MAG: helix-turn-helix transcriptional regulator [Oscillospiraceae bacterium]|nr:helix-turn-helix transcriptional regulator [Oscillospiraceae bacterium]
MVFERIRALREDSDRTQQELADLLHINRRTYSAYENGVNAVPIDILISIARLYDVSTDYLLDLTDEAKPYPKKRKRIP